MSPPPCAHHFSPVSLQALAQELNFSAYLGLPVFMIPLSGPRNANLARLLLNHIHTGHHTSNVRHTVLKTQHAHAEYFYKAEDSGSQSHQQISVVLCVCD